LNPIRRHSGLHLTRVEVQLFAEGSQFGCHVLVEVKGDRTVNVRELEKTIYAAIDLAKDRVVYNLTELRDRMLTVRRHPKKYSFARLARALGWGRRQPV
jgi:ribosome-associated translation inhibitor RaiA